LNTPKIKTIHKNHRARFVQRPHYMESEHRRYVKGKIDSIKVGLNLE